MQAAQREELRRLVDVAARARARGEKIGHCRGCSCLWSERTKACPSCQTRHYARRFYVKNGHLGVPPRCSGCGCAWSEFTVGCGPCRTRRWRRRQRAARS